MTTYTIPSNTYFAQVAVKSFPGIPDCEVQPPWSSSCLDPTQKAKVARKRLQMTTYAIPNNNYFAQVAAKSIPGLPDGEVLPLGVVLAWTPPRWQKWPGKGCK